MSVWNVLNLNANTDDDEVRDVERAIFYHAYSDGECSTQIALAWLKRWAPDEVWRGMVLSARADLVEHHL